MTGLLALLLAVQAEPRSELYRHLEAECAKAFDARRREVEALKTPADVAKRQERLRAKFIEALGGFPEKTPLQPKTTGILERDGYRVEKVVYESRPDHHVTANFYVPAGKGPFPGVLVPCGHSDNGKAAEAYQRACILMAKNGLAVLCYDPIGQGERVQLLAPDGKPAIRGSTNEHTMVGIGALLTGGCCAAYRIWDGIRSIDYLVSRPEIDPKRIGCTGNSGGGTLTSYLMALDERIWAAAPSCYTTTLEKLFATIGPQDAEQNIPGQVAWGMEHADYSFLRAPRPTLICIGSQDYFDAVGAWTTFREAKKVYGVLGHAERMDLFEFDDKHGFSKPRREAAMRWMRRWLLGAGDAPVEGEFPVEKDADLQVTKSGQVLLDFRGRSAFDLNAESEARLAPGRRMTLDAVRRRIGLREAAGTATLAGGVLVPEPGISLPFVDGEGTTLHVGEPGKGATLRLRGQVPQGRPGPFGADWKEAFLGFHLARPLVGQRVEDIRAALAVWGKGRKIRLVASGPACVPALHAAALDPRVAELVSWSAVARGTQTTQPLSNVVPGALADYDLPDLAASLAPRPLTIRGAVDPGGKPVPPEELERVYGAAREAYRKAGAEKALTLAP
jgi:dienelactone hydrolase